jgi:hypothetical protein
MKHTLERIPKTDDAQVTNNGWPLDESNSPQKRKRPRLVRVAGARLNSPPPKSAHQLLYFLIAVLGMARKGESYSPIW